MAQYPESTTVPGILAIRVDAAIYFSNSNYIHDKILQYLEEEQQRLAKAGDPKIQYLILDLTRKRSTDPKHVTETVYHLSILCKNWNNLE